MKHFTQKQIEQAKKINAFDWIIKYHGNKKKVDNLLVTELKSISKKKYERGMRNLDFTTLPPVKKTKEYLIQAKKYKNTPYFKIMIEGNTNIYFASPIFLHNDYNKSIVFPKNEKTLKLMQLFNKIVNK